MPAIKSPAKILKLWKKGTADYLRAAKAKELEPQEDFLGKKVIKGLDRLKVAAVKKTETAAADFASMRDDTVTSLQKFRKLFKPKKDKGPVKPYYQKVCRITLVVESLELDTLDADETDPSEDVLEYLNAEELDTRDANLIKAVEAQGANPAPPPLPPTPPTPAVKPPVSAEAAAFTKRLRKLIPDIEVVKTANTSVTAQVKTTMAEVQRLVSAEKNYTSANLALNTLEGLLKTGMQEVRKAEGPKPGNLSQQRAQPQDPQMPKDKRVAARMEEIEKQIYARARLDFNNEVRGDKSLFRATKEKDRPVTQLKTFGTQDAQQLLGKVKQNSGLAVYAAGSLGGIAKDLEDGVLERTKKEAIKQAEAKGQELVKTIPPEGLVDLFAMSPQQRQNEIVKSMGLIKSKYAKSGYNDLSEDKKRLVDATCTGLEAQLQLATAGVVAHCTKTGADAMQKVLGSLPADSDKIFDLSMKSDADLKADVAMALGLVSADEIKSQKAAAAVFVPDAKFPNITYTQVQLKWFDKLTSSQRTVVMSTALGMQKAIDSSCPNKFKPAANPAQEVVSLNGEDYEFAQELGQGGLGVIKKFKKIGSDEYVVVKSLLKPEKRLEMEREMIVHRLAMGGEGGKGHPNITPFKGMVRGPDGSLHMILEEAKGGDLDKVAGSVDFAKNTGALPPAAAVVLQQQFILEAVAGLKELQEIRNLTHHDIKAKNFLVREDGTVMLADFGSGQVGRDAQGTVPGKGDHSVNIPITPDVVAPEMQDQTITGKADTYTLGVMIHRMMGGNDNRRVKPAQGPKPAYKGPPLSALDKLTNAMLDDDPSKRPTLEAVENSSFLKDGASHDPEQVAELKAATMQYSKVVGKMLGMKSNDAALKAHDPGSTLPNQGSKSLQEVIQTYQLEIDKCREELPEKEADLQKVLQKPRSALIQQGIDAHAADPRKNADGIGKELNLTKEQIKELRPFLNARDFVVGRQQKIATNTQGIEAIMKVVNTMVQADKAGQEAEKKLKAAAAPFSTNTDNRLEAMPDLMKRFTTIAGNVRDVANLVSGTKVHAQLLAKQKAFLDAHDKKDAVAARKLIRELEDFVALAAGSKEIREFVQKRQELEAREKDSVGDNALRRVENELNTLMDTFALGPPAQ